MGQWCVYDLLSGSDGGLRLALEFCDKAGHDYTDWPEDVQEYSRLRPDHDGSGLTGSLQYVSDSGPAFVSCQATQATYAAVSISDLGLFQV